MKMSMLIPSTNKSVENTVRSNTIHHVFLLMFLLSTGHPILQAIQVLHIIPNPTPLLPSPDFRAQVGVETLFQVRGLSLFISLGSVRDRP